MKKIKKSLEKTKGITLVALVVTIVVLLILAGVTITMLFGENGIIKKAQEAKEATERDQNDEITGINQLESQINSYITGTNNNNALTKIVGKLDVTYRVEGTKVYFYPTIDGYNNLSTYCQGKVIPILKSITTQEEKEKFVINYCNMFAGTELSSSEEALEIINANNDTPYSSCVEAYDDMMKELNNMESIELLLYYLISIYDNILENEREYLALHGFNFISETIKYETIGDLLEYLNEEKNSSYTTLKEAFEEEYGIMIGYGLLSDTAIIKLEYKDEILAYSIDNLLADECAIFTCNRGFDEKCTFVVSNGLESKEGEIKIDTTNMDIYYNRFYSSEDGSPKIVFLTNGYALDDGIPRSYTINNRGIILLDDPSINVPLEVEVKDNENIIYGITGLFSKSLSLTDKEHIKKNSDGYYNNAIYWLENPEDSAEGENEAGTLCVDEKGTVFFWFEGSSSSMGTGIKSSEYTISDDGKLITKKTFEGKILRYKLIEELYVIE